MDLVNYLFLRKSITSDDARLHVKSTISDIIYMEGSPLDALLYARLFWPNFIEIDGMIFRDGTFEDEEDLKRLKEAREEFGDDFIRLEKSFNSVEVSALFGRKLGDTDEEGDKYLVDVLVESWGCRLRQLFPGREFTVRPLDSEEADGEVGIVFHQNKHGQLTEMPSNPKQN